MQTELDSIDYVSDPRDRARLLCNPLLMMPHHGVLPPLPLGRRRYVAAADGLYIQARNHALSVTLKFADTPALPYGPLQESVHMVGGPLPLALYRQIEDCALAQSPAEWAALVHWEPLESQYQLTIPETIECSGTHIRYRTDQIRSEYLVLNLHTHGTLPAYFSTTDDASDQLGVYFACVLGRCHSRETLECRSRIVVDGFHYPLVWHPWEESIVPASEPANQE